MTHLLESVITAALIQAVKGITAEHLMIIRLDWIQLYCHLHIE